MKTIAIIVFMFCLGCATQPVRPDITQMALDVMAGRGQSLEQINQTFANYDKAREEYENSASYKMKILAVVPLLVLGVAASDVPYYRYGYYGGWRGYGCGYRGYGYPGCGYRPGKTIVNSIPTGGGGYMTTIKHYK